MVMLSMVVNPDSGRGCRPPDLRLARALIVTLAEIEDAV
jgi:hypothetical protein